LPTAGSCTPAHPRTRICSEGCVRRGNLSRHQRRLAVPATRTAQQAPDQCEISVWGTCEPGTRIAGGYCLPRSAAPRTHAEPAEAMTTCRSSAATTPGKAVTGGATGKATTVTACSPGAGAILWALLWVGTCGACRSLWRRWSQPDDTGGHIRWLAPRSGETPGYARPMAGH
jgi:hypothetical protein